MNLFRQLTNAPAKSASKPALPQVQFKPGFYTYVSLGLSSVIGLGMFLSYSSHTASIKASQKTIEQSQAQLKTVMAQAEAVAAEIQKLKEERQANKNPSLKGLVSTMTDDFEDNWTSLLWKLSSLTGTGIVISQMELTKAGAGASGRTARAVTLSGSALTLSTVRDWLDRLTKEVPGYDFSIDSQTSSSDTKYPIAFRVSAKVI